MRQLGHVRALDGLRGVAIGLVVAYHAGVLPGGFLGVDVFFVLSGFLITTLLLEEHEETGRISFRSFYMRRARRLLPALAVLCLVLAAIAIPIRDGRMLGDIALTLGYAANIVRAAGHHFVTPLTTMWSLGEEEQFYLLWPLLFAFALRRTRGSRLVVPLVLGAIAIACWRATLTLSGASVDRVVFSPDTHFDPLVIGCALAVARVRWALPNFGLAAAVVLGVDVAVSRGGTTWTLLAGYLLAGLAAAGLVGAAAADGVPFLRWRPLVALGKVSYSLYVWQAFAFNIAMSARIPLAAGVPLALVLAVVSYRYVERPFRRRRGRYTPIIAR